MSDQLPEGKRRADRKVDVPAAPTTTLAELMSRPTRNTVEIGRQTFPETRPVTRIELDPAPIIDVRRLGPQVPRGDRDLEP